MPIRRIDPVENEVLAGLEAKTKQANLFYRVMANRPDVLKNFPPFYAAIMGHGPVERRIKELVYLTCSIANRCAYCIAAHTAGGHKAGVTDAEIQAIRDEQNDGFAQAEQAVIVYARELTRTATVSEATREALR